MQRRNILDLDYSVFSQIQSILDNPGTMKSFLEVLPPECSCENVLLSMELESKKYSMTPAKVLLTYLGSKGFGTSHLIQWFQDIQLEKALVLLREEESLRIVVQPEKEVTVSEGREIILSCIAISYPPPEYQWFKDDVELLLQVDSRLVLKSASMKDSGRYTCCVTKWNRQANAYEFIYSDYSTVHVIPSELHALRLLSQGSHQSSSVPNFMSSAERKLSSQNHFVEAMVPLPKESSVIEPVHFDKNGHCLSPHRKVITIIKHPYVNGKISQGMNVYLTCEASSSQPVNYLWIKNGRPLLDEKSPELILKNIYPDPVTGEYKWKYQCAVYNEHDRVYSDIAVVELDEVNDTTPFIAQQKYAFMVANDAYIYLEHLKKPAADVKDLATILSSMRFKIFAHRNLTLIEMRNAFDSFCKMLLPGSYALFFFAGHGFDSCGQTYLQSVDSSDNLVPNESMCLEYILQRMQETKPAVNILFVDACRNLPPNFCELPHGKIFEAKMENNTMIGYSTSFLSASHENDDDDNSVFVKYLKKYISQNKCIRDILQAVQSEFSKDSVVKKIQHPVIKSSLAANRKLDDPVHGPVHDPYFTSKDIMNWCDIKREPITILLWDLSKFKVKIIAEFHHHMGIFCNGTDMHVFLLLEPDADKFLLEDIEIKIKILSPELHTKPMKGVCLKDLNLTTGSRNFLFKEEILNIQKLNTRCLEGDVSLKIRSENFEHNKPFNVDFIQIVRLQLPVNRLKSSNVEECDNYTVVKNIFE